MPYELIKIASFANGEEGGNPAGVVLSKELPSEAEMQKTAADVGFSETVFAAQLEEGWRVRYFSPKNEVPFCGHATIALGAAIAHAHGAGEYPLYLNNGEISVEGGLDGDPLSARLKSLPTRNEPVSDDTLNKALSLMGLARSGLDASMPPARIHAGADHLLLALKSRQSLAAMDYDLNLGRDFMLENGFVTIMLVVQQDATSFDVRNAFASGGVLEDPATGAAATAFGGYLRDAGLIGLNWQETQALMLRQGDDMGAPSRLTISVPPQLNSPVLVSGKVRLMD